MSAAVGGPPVNHGHSDSVNGKQPTIPAVPSPSINGNSSFTNDHNRKPSMTVTPAGATTYNANGAPQNKANIIFGSVNTGGNTGSPAMGTPPSLAQQPNNNLGVNSLNARIPSPQNSPSPIPQPVSVSGGRPPSGFQNHNNNINFGFGNDGQDQNGVNRSMSQLQLGPNQEHMRRGSSQSVHSDMGGQGLPTGPGRGGYPAQGGRGRGGYHQNSYQNPMSYSPHQNFRPAQNGRNSYQNQSRHNMQFQGSPSMAPRTPLMNNVNPGTPQMNPMHMVPGMQGQPAAYQYGPYSVNPSFPFKDSVRGKSNRGNTRGTRASRGGRGPVRSGSEKDTSYGKDPALDCYNIPSMGPIPNPVALFPYPDISPESGVFEHFLTSKHQGYQVPTAVDPSIQYMYNQNYYQQQQQQQGQYANYPPPQSPRPPFQQPGYGTHMQPSYSNQGQGPQSMSRQSSQMSTTDRPASVVGQPPHTPGPITSQVSARTPSQTTEKPAFIPPVKKSNALVIKNAAGEVMTFGKPPASPAPPAASTSAAAPAASSTPLIPTPPSRTGSAIDGTQAKSESAIVQSNEDKKRAMQEAVAKKVAEEQEKVRKADEQKVQLEKEATEAAAREAEKVKEEEEAAASKKKADEEAAAAAAAKKAEDDAKAAEAEAAEIKAAEVKAAEAKAAEEKAAEEKAAEAKAAEAKAAEAEKEKSIQAAKPDDDEPDFDAIEAEMAAIEAEEARREEEYQKKKQAAKEAQRKKELEEEAAYEATMKEMERKAEEAELAREKKRNEGTSANEDPKKTFASLRSGEGATSTPDESTVDTPEESGAVTPVSDASMPPPAKNVASSKRPKTTDLTLDTKKTGEAPEPSATLKSLVAAKPLEDPTQVSYPDGISSPSTVLNSKAPADRKFKYDMEFLLQFQAVFKEKPTLDWDQKIRDALGDGDSGRTQSARTPSGISGRSASNRPQATPNAFQPMGLFGTRSSLPAGTTSEQRFAASNAAMRGGPVAANPFAFGRGTMGPPVGRSPSNNPLASIPGSPRGGGPSRGGSRAESKRNKHGGKQEADQNKNMPLTAGMNITTLEVSSTGWKPRSVGQGVAPSGPVGLDGYMEADVVQRKVKAALNKMTPEKFDRIADQVLEIAAQSKHESDGRTLRQVIQLTFEKATDEAHWASMYAMFCAKMLSSMSPDIKDENIKDKNGNVVTGGNLFRKYLLNRCQEEFERGWKVNLPPNPEGQNEEAVMLSDEYYIAAAAKRRGLGLVKFIGELFKLGMLTERIMHECVKKLLDYEGIPDDAEVESLCSLLRTIGKQLDSSESKGAARMDVYFERINQTIQIPDLPSRLKFMLMDVVDLRRLGWDGKDTDKGPKTIQQIHEEAEKAVRDADMARLASQAGGRGGGRMPMGRGDARSFSAYGQVPPPDNSNRVGADDLRRLGGRSQRNTSTPSGSFGPSGLGARTNSGRRGLGPGLLRPGDDSNVSSRTGTPPAQKDKEKKDESSMNAFSALAALEGAEGPTSPPSDPSSPPTQKLQPIERERSRSPGKSAE